MLVNGGMNMVKFLSQYTNYKDFFSQLKENEIFMYSYHDFNYDDIVRIAEENKINVEYIKKGTDDYKKYGECAVRVVNINEKIYKYKISSGEVIEVKAKNENFAKHKLIDYLFKEGYISLVSSLKNN